MTGEMHTHPMHLSSRGRRRSRPRPGRALLCLVLAVGCSSSTEQTGEPEGTGGAARRVSSESEAAPAPEPTPELALGYEAGDAPGERRIAEAQRRVREAPQDVDALCSLAVAMMRRQRATSNGAYMRYAEDALEAAIAREPEHTTALALWTMRLQDAHRFREAADTAERVIAAAPDDPTGHLLLGDARLELGEYEAAGRAYQHAMDLRPDLRAYERGAHLRWLHGDVDGAMELAQLAIDAGSPRDPEPIAWSWVQLGWIHWHRGEPERAEAAAGRAKALVSDYAPAMVLEGRALAAQGRTDAAIAQLERAVARRASAEPLLALADLLETAGRDDEAAQRRAAAEALADHEPRPVALSWARRDERTERAVELARIAVRRRETIDSQDALALALARAGRTDEARRAMDDALALGTPDARLHLHRAVVRLEAGDEAGARESLTRARRMNPHADPVLAAELEARLDRGEKG